MAEMNLAARLLAQIAGGTAAAYVDQAYPNLAQPVGSVSITPGAMGAVGLTVLALAFPKLPARELVANLGGGALVYEGVKLGQTKIIPLLSSGAQVSTQTSVLPGGAVNVPTGYLPGGYAYGNHMPDWQLQQNLMSLRG